MPSIYRGTPYSASATGTGSATAAPSTTATANKTFYVTDLTASSDLANSTIQVKDGSTVIWQDQILQTAAGVSWYGHTFATPLSCTRGNALTVVVTGTSHSNANVAGFIENNT